MTHSQHLQNRLHQQEKILLNGGMGTEILRRGVPTTLPLWSAEALLTHPQVVQKIHEDYITAGAEIIVTNTFRTTRRTFAKEGIAERAHATTLLACQLAHQALEEVQPPHAVYIAGSIAPLEDCYSPQLTPPEEALVQEHEIYAQALVEGGVDFLLLETMITLRETMAAIQAAKKCHIPFAVSFCTNAQGNLLGGESLEEVVREVEKYDPLFLGVNCISPALGTATLASLKKFTSKPLSVYAQGEGMPHDEQGWEFMEEKQSEDYLMHAQRWIQEGALVIGGCCGTSPAYIEKLRALF